MRTKLLVGLLALTSTFALVSCDDDKITSPAQAIWDMLTPVYEEYKTKPITADTELFKTVADFSDITISYTLATDIEKDADGNVFTNDQDFVTVKEKDEKIFLTVTESEKHNDPVYVNLRAAIKVDDQDYSHDFTIQAGPLKKTLQGTIGEVKDKFLKLHPTMDGKAEKVIVTGTVVSFDWGSQFKNGYLYLADADGRGIYAFRAKVGADIDGDAIAVTDKVTITGTLDAVRGLQINNGKITEVETGAGEPVNPIPVDESNWGTIGASYINAGDWLGVENVSVVADVPEITTAKDQSIKVKIGAKDALWYVNKYTNAGNDCYQPINALQLKAADKIDLIVPLGFHGSTAQLSWALGSSVRLVSLRD